MSGARIRAIYIVLYMAFATWRVFYNVYLEENHFTGVEIGVINAMIQATVFVIVPIWGVIADKRGIRPTLRIAAAASAILLLFLGNMLNFWGLLIYMFILTIFHHPLGPMIDALAVQFAEKRTLYNYGNLRLWGSFGWAVASVAGGLLFIHFNLKYIFPASAMLFLCTILFLRTPKNKPGELYKPHFERIRIKELSQNRSLLIFLAILFVYGIASSPVNAYMNLYFLELGADNSVIGIAYTVQSLSELPFFIIGNRLLKRFGSTQVILISMVIMTLRLFIYSSFPGIKTALVACSLQGITLSFLLVGVVDYLHRQLPKSRHATAQSILWGLYFGLGHTIGNFLIGWLKDISGMVGVMHIFAFITLGILLFTATDFGVQKLKINFSGKVNAGPE
jgi:PPP family 3-phenylpropionic acid transporter